MGLGDGFAIVIEARSTLVVTVSAGPRAGDVSSNSKRELPVCFSREPRAGPRSVKSSKDDPRRPDAVWLDGSWHPVTVLGRYRSADLALA